VDVPKKARNELKIIPVEHMDQVLDFALNPEVKREVKPVRARKKKEKGTESTEETSKPQYETARTLSETGGQPEVVRPEDRHQERPQFRIVLD
jgi:hypothetical protein